ncbi:MAG: hypothetical protein Q9195_002507 [Heterodermia aff. obscurata]
MEENRAAEAVTKTLGRLQKYHGYLVVPGDVDVKSAMMEGFIKASKELAEAWHKNRVESAALVVCHPNTYSAPGDNLTPFNQANASPVDTAPPAAGIGHLDDDKSSNLIDKHDARGPLRQSSVISLESWESRDSSRTGSEPYMELEEVCPCTLQGHACMHHEGQCAPIKPVI